MDSGRGPVAVALAGLVAACVVSFAIGTPPRSPRGEPAARAFLATWRESRTATFVVEHRFTRTLPDGDRLEQSSRVVQRPPDDRLLIGFGTASGRVDGRVVRCAGAPGSGPRCLTSVVATPYDEEVQAELDALAGTILGDQAAYRVIELSDGPERCFRLDLAIALPSPPYGDHALFCFDRANHAPVLTVVERPEAIDRTEAVTVRTTVFDADLAVTGDLGQVLGAPGPTTTTTTATTTTAGN